jgi:tetratricopeptide (TPR) repeat protein
MGIFYQRAGELYDQQRYDLAQRDLLRELEQSPDHADAHALLGMCQHFLKQKDEALTSCKEAIRLAPGSAYAHYALGCVQVDFDRFDEAAQSVQEAIRLDPTSPFYQGQLSYIRWRQGRHEEALASADAGLALDARNTFCLNRRAMALGYLGRLDEAEEVVRVALAVDPENSFTLANCGWILMKRGRGDEAAQTLRDALRRNPQMSWARDHLMDTLVLLIRQKQSKLVLKHFDESLERDPSLAEGRQQMALALAGEEMRFVAFLVLAGWVIACSLGPCLALLAVSRHRQEPAFGHFGKLLLVLDVLLVLDFVVPPTWTLGWVAQALALWGMRLGQRLIPVEQRRTFRLILVAASGAVAAGVVTFFTGSEVTGTIYALLVALIVPLAYLPLCRPGWPRTILNVYLGSLAVWGLTLVLQVAFGHLSKAGMDVSRGVLVIVGAGCSGLLGRALEYFGKRQAAKTS